MSRPNPVLPSAETLAGNWRLSWDGGGCDINLSAKPVPMPGPAAGAWDLTMAAACEGHPALQRLQAWRPAPDGIDLTDERGRTRLFLSRHESDVFEAVLTGGDRIRLTRG